MAHDFQVTMRSLCLWGTLSRGKVSSSTRLWNLTLYRPWQDLGMHSPQGYGYRVWQLAWICISMSSHFFVVFIFYIAIWYRPQYNILKWNLSNVQNHVKCYYSVWTIQFKDECNNSQFMIMIRCNHCKLVSFVSKLTSLITDPIMPCIHIA